MAVYTITDAKNVDELPATGQRVAVAWTRSGTTITVTLVGHNLTASTAFYVSASSATGPVTIGAKTVATVVNANTFTFTGVNTGATSGTLTLEAPEIYNINGGTLTVDQDTRFGEGTNPGAHLGAITLSGTLGGTLTIDATAVRLIPFNSGSGNVPAAGTVITGGGGSGKLIGVWSAVNVAPTAAGDPMPTSGFIKVKQVTGAYSAGALAGIAATATGADVAGWVEIVGLAASVLSSNRLNDLTILGDWYVVGETTGNNTSTYQLPTSGQNQYYAGVWVEDTVSSGEYTFFPNVANRPALLSGIGTDKLRGGVCWINDSGILRFQNDGTNDTGGHLPSAGLRIRIPSLNFQNVAADARTVNAVPSDTLTARYTTTFTGGASVSFRRANFAWYPRLNRCYTVDMRDVAVNSAMLIQNTAQRFYMENVHVGHALASIADPLSCTLNVAGGDFIDCSWTRLLGATNSRVAVLTTNVDLSFLRCAFRQIAGRTQTTNRAFAAARLNNCSWDSCVIGVSSGEWINCANCLIKDTTYYDVPTGTTKAAQAVYALTVGASCINLTFDGYSHGDLVGVAPYLGLFTSLVALSSNIQVRNIGSPSSPLDLGEPKVYDVAWSRSSSTVTVTSPNHGLAVGDILLPFNSSSVAAVTIAVKTITAVPDNNTFVFTGANSGATTGTLSYYRQISNGVFVTAASSSAFTFNIQRVFTKHTRGPAFAFDNTDAKPLIESSGGEYLHATIPNASDAVYRQHYGQISTAAALSVYGSNFYDCYIQEPANFVGAAWTRATTVITVTAVNHGLVSSSLSLVEVYATSDIGTVRLGTYTVTPLTKDTFTITGVNAGPTSGTLSFKTLDARIGVLFNEASPTQGAYTVDSGNPRFTSLGTLSLPVTGDQVTFESPYYIKGHTFFGADAIFTSGFPIADLDFTYSIDKNDGDGFSAYKNLSYTRLAASGVNGTPTVVLNDATGVSVGDYVFAASAVALGTRVDDISGNTLTLNQNLIGTVTASAPLRFNHIPNETGIDPEDGFKLRVRIRARVDNVAPIVAFYIRTGSTTAAREFLYPLDTVPVSLTNLVAGSEIRAFLGTDPATAVEIAGVENSGTSFTFTHSNVGQEGYIVVHSVPYETIRIPVTYASSPQEFLVQQRFDRNYENP